MISDRRVFEAIRVITPLNENYNPPRPWACVTPAQHECDGHVLGAVGAYPVCWPGAVAEVAARDAERARIDAWTNSPEGQRAIATEIAIERRIEGRR